MVVGWWVVEVGDPTAKFTCLNNKPYPHTYTHHHHHETQAGKAGKIAKGKEKQTTTKKKKKRRSLRDINSLYRIPREEAQLLEERLEEWKTGEAERTGMSGWNVLTQQMVGGMELRGRLVVVGCIDLDWTFADP